MDDLKISQLNPWTPIDTDILPYVDLLTGETKKALKSDLEGSNWTDWKTILNWTIDPTTEWVDGDFYINTVSNEIFWPKDTTWGTWTSLVWEDWYTPIKWVDYFDGNDWNWIASLELVSTVWLIKTYRITFDNATTFDYFTTDWINWTDWNDWTDWKWIQSQVLLSTVWKVKTYRITYTDATTFDYTVTDWADGTGAWLVDWDYWDITVGWTGTTMTIDSDAVDFDKMQDIPTNRILGRDSSGNWDVEAITIPNFKSMVSLDNVDNTSDEDKPISDDTQTALDWKLDLAWGTMTWNIALNWNYLSWDWGNEWLFVSANWSVGINNNNPQEVLHVIWRTDLQTGSWLALKFWADVNSNNLTNNTRKFGRIWFPHYNTTGLDVLFFVGDSDGVNNKLNIWGGSTAAYAATELRFLTAANDTATNGVTRMTITNNWDIGIWTVNPLYKMDVDWDISWNALYLQEWGNRNNIKKAYSLTATEWLRIDIWSNSPNYFTVYDNSWIISNNVFQVQQRSFGWNMIYNWDGGLWVGETDPDTKLHVNGAITQNPLTSDPADPSAWNSVQWVSNGTGSWDAWDVMMKINVWGTTKIVTLVDFSNLT